MGIPYHPGIKSTFDGMATHILSRQGQSQTNAVKVQNYMATMFWDRCGVLLIDFMRQETKINSGAYCATLRSSEEYCKTNGGACCQKVMCVQYWPTDLDKPEEYGNLEITLLAEEQLANFFIRTVKIRKSMMLDLTKVVFSILLSGMMVIGRAMESGRRGYGSSSGWKVLEFFGLAESLDVAL
ncbi:hypothetical protein TNCV_4479851 [Trichonephila clavipes]|nr:hypothetical protein TNCV_4479851 [Trichonephila clavipes]